MRKALVVVPVVGVLLLVGGDLLVGSLMESRLEQLAQRRLGLRERPTVDLQGFPFAYHALVRRFPGAALQGRNLRVEGLAVDRFVLELRDVRLVSGDARGDDTLRARAGRGTVEVTQEALRQYLERRGIGVRVELRGPSHVRVVGRTSVLGFEAEASAEGVLAMKGRSLEFRPARVTVGDGISVPASALSFRVQIPEPLPGMQYEDLIIERGRAILSFRFHGAVLPS